MRTALLGALLGVLAPIHAVRAESLDLELDSQEWRRNSQGPFSVRVDRRGVMTMSHGSVPAEAGSYGAASRTVPLPAGYKGPLVLRFYLTDDYVGDRQQPVFFRDGVQERVSDWKEEVRFAQVLLDDVVVWSKDVLGRNGTTPGARFYDLEISELLKGKAEVEVTLRVQDVAGTGEEPFATDVFWARAELLWRFGETPPPVDFPPRLPFRREKFGQATGSAPKSGATALTIRNLSGAEIAAWPIRWGVPLPQGAITEPTQVALQDASGQPLALQTQVLSRWPDGSAKWALLDFVAPLAAGDTGYELQYGGGVAGETAGSTGSPGWLDGIGERFWLRSQEEGGQWRARPVGDWEVRADGPVCGEYSRQVSYGPEGAAPSARGLVDVIYYENPAMALVRHTLEVGGQKEGLALRELGLELPNAAGPEQPDTAGQPATVLQIDADRLVTDGTEAEGRWDGVVPQAEGRFAALRWPWQQFPVGYRTTAGRTDLLLYAGPDRGEPLALAPGEAKSHEIMLYLGENAPTPELARELNTAFQQPPVLLFEPEWLAATGAVGPFLGQDERRFPRYEQAAGRIAAELAARRDNQQAYGFEHFGDTQFQWGYGEPLTYWANTEYDHAHALLWQFLRTGDPELFYAGCQAALHYRDVDIIHASEQHPDWIGGAHHHSETHTGHGPSISHHWTEGLFDHWLLTGDSRSLECANLAGEYAKRVALRSSYTGGERDAGWNLIALMGAYRATDDAAMLEAATKKVEEVLGYLDAVRGVSSRPIYEQTAYEGGVPFMAGVLMRGLTAYYDETRDERVGWAICGLCDWLDCEMMPTPGRFSYKQAPQLRHASPQLLVLDGTAFAWAFTGDPTYRQLALDVYEAGIGSVGLTNVRDMPHALALLAGALPPVRVASVRCPLMTEIGGQETPEAIVSLWNLSGKPETVQVSLGRLSPATAAEPRTVTVPPEDKATDVSLAIPSAATQTGLERFVYEVTVGPERIGKGELGCLALPRVPRVLLLGEEDGLTAQALELLGVPLAHHAMADFAPDLLEQADLLVCGFDESRAPLEEHREAVAAWVESGGVVLGFRDSSGWNGWLPSPVKQDASYQPGELLQPDSGAFSLFSRIDPILLAAVHGGSMYRAFYDLGPGWVPLASAGGKQTWDQTQPASDGPHYGLVELEHGRGRIILCQLIPEYAWLHDDGGRFGSPGRQLLENLVGYACMAATR